MSGPILALRAAILAHLRGDGELGALMGGQLRLHDEPPRAAEPVYGVFGDVRAEDWSTDLDRGHRQEATIRVWAREGSARSGLLAAERMSLLLHDAALALNGHRLVSLRVSAIAAAKDERSNLTRATLTLVAVTEVLPVAP
ncbi:MAG TPA: DUF3168 domain-containing protein [Microvirga sp.]|jgi:hypothetical protein